VPRGRDLRSSALDVASCLIGSLFSPNTKSVSTGRVVGSSQSVICHDASTVGGFCGAPGVNLNTSGGFKFSFIHNGTLLIFQSSFLNITVGEHPNFSAFANQARHNHGLSVNDPTFRQAYMIHVIPRLRDARASLTGEQRAAIEAYAPNSLA
jgi:hypothetical protein